MRKFMLLSSCFVLISLLAHADDAGLKKKMQAKYDGFVKAFLAKDEKAISKMAAPGFVSIGPDGTKMDSFASLKMLKEQMKQMAPDTKYKVDVTKATAKDNTVIVLTKSTMSTKMPGKDKKLHAAVMKGTSEDVWLKVGEDYKVIQVADKSSSLTLDGKPAKMEDVMGGAQQGSGPKPDAKKK